MQFTGLCAFPPTPFIGGAADERGFRRIVGRLAATGVDSIGALGSTGHYAYLPVAERVRLTAAAVDAAQRIPVLTSVGAVATADVLALTEAVQQAGAAAVLLAPVSYQPLTRDEVLGLYTDVTAVLDVPLCVYDNPATTGFVFDVELLAEIAALPGVASVKMLGAPAGATAARVAALRAVLPAHVTIGVAGDRFAADGLLAGCDAWYSAIAGVLPAPAQALQKAVAAGDGAGAQAISAALAQIWQLFADYGSARVVAAIAGELSLADAEFLPRPLLPLDEAGQARVRAAISAHR